MILHNRGRRRGARHPRSLRARPRDLDAAAELSAASPWCASTDRPLPARPAVRRRPDRARPGTGGDRPGRPRHQRHRRGGHGALAGRDGPSDRGRRAPPAMRGGSRATTCSRRSASPDQARPGGQRRPRGARGTRGLRARSPVCCYCLDDEAFLSALRVARCCSSRLGVSPPGSRRGAQRGAKASRRLAVEERKSRAAGAPVALVVVGQERARRKPPYAPSLAHRHAAAARALALAAAACGDGAHDRPRRPAPAASPRPPLPGCSATDPVIPGGPMPTSTGAGEGRLNLVVRAGYADDAWLSFPQAETGLRRLRAGRRDVGRPPSSCTRAETTVSRPTATCRRA